VRVTILLCIASWLVFREDKWFRCNTGKRQVFESGEGWGDTKNGFTLSFTVHVKLFCHTGGLSPVSRAPYARVWRRVPGPFPSPEKHEFPIGRDAISRCLEGPTCTLQSLLSRSSITFSIPPPRPHYFYVLRDSYFQQWGGTYSRPPPITPPVVNVKVSSMTKCWKNFSLPQ